MMTFITAHKALLQRLGAVLLALCLWQGAAWYVGYQLLIPAPLAVVGRLGTIWQEAGFAAAIWFTFRRIVTGFLLALGAGILLGGLAGRFSLVEILVRPYMVVIKSVPVASFVLICLIWLSAGRLSTFIAFLIVLPVVYHNVLQGIQSVDGSMLEAANVFHLSWGRRLRYLWLPQLRPFLLSACSVGLGMSWKAGIAAEIIGIPDGSMGRMFYDAKIYFNTVDLFAWTVIVVAVSVLFEKVFLALFKSLLGRLTRG